MTMIRKTFLLPVSVLVLAAIACAAGCDKGPAFAEVTGTATVDGKPTGGLQVLFDPADSELPPSLGLTQSDGSYKLMAVGGKPGAAVGKHTVRVSVMEGDGSEGPAITIPERYNSLSEMSCDVQPGPNTHNIEVTSR